jgi:hypothetical protein
MTASLLICETGTMPAVEPSPEYVAAARAYARANELVEQRRKDLLPLLLEEARKGVPYSKLARESGYAQSYISKLARDAGIPARTDHEAPRRKPKAADD